VDRGLSELVTAVRRKENGYRLLRETGAYDQEGRESGSNTRRLAKVNSLSDRRKANTGQTKSRILPYS